LGVTIGLRGQSRTKSQTSYLLVKRRIDADKIGKQWVTTRRRMMTACQRSMTKAPQIGLSSSLLFDVDIAGSD
jgi:hypothetical protein